MKDQIFTKIINKNNNDSYFSIFEKLFFKKLKKIRDEFQNPDNSGSGYLTQEHVAECFLDAKKEIKEIKKRRQYELNNESNGFSR